jgi:hypothetical protein
VSRMETTELDRLRQAYKMAVDQWVATIREEEELATPDHSMVQMERWDAACFREQDAKEKAQAAKDKYKDALRQVNYSF